MVSVVLLIVWSGVVVACFLVVCRIVFQRSLLVVQLPGMFLEVVRLYLRLLVGVLLVGSFVLVRCILLGCRILLLVVLSSFSCC